VRIILGIGNFGNRYKRNRHNAGFMQLDYITGKYSLTFIPSKGDYYFAEGKVNIDDFILIKPTTYVNNSGIAALQVLQNYKIDPKDILVVADDINLSFSELRIRISGGDGGHNGLNSIIYHLSSDQFPRLRIGVGSTFENGNLVDYVLTDFDKKERKKLEKTFNTCTVLLEEFIKGGLESMLDSNSRLSQLSKDENLVD